MNFTILCLVLAPAGACRLKLLTSNARQNRFALVHVVNVDDWQLANTVELTSQ